MASTSLYVGKLPMNITRDEMQSVFGRFQPTRIDLRHGKSFDFAFVEIASEMADEAIRQLNHYDLRGNQMIVEVSHGGSGVRRERVSSNTCFNCGQPGHFSRDCPNPHRDERRDFRDDRRGEERSDHRYVERSRSPPHREGSEGSDRDDRRRSRSRSRSGSHSRHRHSHGHSRSRHHHSRHRSPSDSRSPPRR